MDVIETIEELTDDEDMLDLIATVGLGTPNRIRPRVQNFQDWRERDFFTRFRISKNGAHFVLTLISEQLNVNTTKPNAVTAEGMLLIALSFYASDSFMAVCGDRHGLDKSTICHIVHKVSKAIASHCDEFIDLPSSEEEVRDCKRDFYQIARFPKCIGAMYCTHIRIQSPGGRSAETFRNRKGFFSLNVQTVADAHLKIRDIVVRWAGSAHDSLIFLNSALRWRLEEPLYVNSVLVADRGYGIRPQVMTPIMNPTTRSEQLFNESLVRTRNVVERSYGVWKRRFPVLANGLRVKVTSVEPIVVATAVLHNIAIILGETVPRVDEETEAAIQETIEVPPFDNFSITTSSRIRDPRASFLSYFQRRI